MSNKNTIIVNDYNNSDLLKVQKLGFTSYTAAERKYEPQTQNTFSFQFLFDKGQVAYIGTAANMQKSSIAGADEIDAFNYNNGLRQINDILNTSMQGLTSPTKNIGAIMIDFFNSQIKYAGKPTYNNANITLNTLIGLGSKNVLAAWSDICLNERTLEGGWSRSLKSIVEGPLPQKNANEDDETYLNRLFPLIGYKCDGILLECARDGSIVNQWDYIGMWISSFTPGSFNMAGANTPSQITATITVDKIQQATTKTVLSRVNNYQL